MFPVYSPPPFPISPFDPLIPRRSSCSESQSLGHELQAAQEELSGLQALYAELASVRKYAIHSSAALTAKKQETDLSSRETLEIDSERAELEKSIKAADAKIATQAKELTRVERNMRQASNRAESLQAELDRVQQGKKPIAAVIVSATAALAISFVVGQFQSGRREEETA